jgi:large subunit ribosomal protein L6
MSRKGKLPIQVPTGVDVQITSEKIVVKGPKGTLHRDLVPAIVVTKEGNVIHVSLHDDHADKGNFHGLFRTLIDNMVVGVTKGFAKQLEMIGVGYRAVVQGNSLDLQIGVSHPTKLPIPNGLQVAVANNTVITVSGVDNQQVGQFCAVIRSKRPPEPYQGKGIRYVGEYVRKKAGKAAAKK